MLGAIIGDIVGNAYLNNKIKKKDFELFTMNSKPTDDTIMTLAVAECIQNNYHNDTPRIIKILKKWGKNYPDAGYGKRFTKWLLNDLAKPYNSCGNGAAMRISSVGWYAQSEEEVKIMSRQFTSVTHNHQEGLKGAEITAMCVYYARIGKTKEFIYDYVSKYYVMNFKYEDLLENYKFYETCQDTVPQAIYCFLISNSFVDCLRTTISIGGDCDTTSAISCAIAEAYYKEIDQELILNAIKLLPGDSKDCSPTKILQKFLKYKNELVMNKKDMVFDLF